MDVTRFHRVINFAVEREQEAVRFYANLQKSAAFDAHKSLLQELENMEKGHILILEKMRKKSSTEKEDKVVQNLKISDYLVAEDNVQPDSYPNILLLAMKREEKSHQLYLHLSERFATEDQELGNLFARLAAEEAGHKLKFEKLYDQDVLRDN